MARNAYKHLGGTMLERIEMCVDRSAGPDGCHPWVGGTSHGKPVISFGRRNYSPRRVLFEQAHGLTLRFELRVNSHCDNQFCCNVKHLWGGEPELRLHCLLDKSGGPDACWPYLGALDAKGYGRLGVLRGERYFAHRLAYHYATGEVFEDEEVIMHACDNPPCCNPKHLSRGTHADNHHDMLAKGRSGWQKAKAAGLPWPPPKVAVGQSESVDLSNASRGDSK